MKKITQTLCFTLIFFLAGYTVVLSQPSLVLNTSNDPPNSTDAKDGICDLVIKEAFRRLEIELTIVRLPSERALINANDGVDDGNFARVGGLSETYPNLIQVPEPITRFEFVVITAGKHFSIANWSSLAPYNVAIVTGWKILEQNITDTKSLTRVDNRHILLNLLKAGRVDCIVYDRQQALAAAKEESFSDLTILQPPLTVKDMYPYLHKKHQELVPRLAETIRGIKNDGTYDDIVGKVMAPYRRAQ